MTSGRRIRVRGQVQGVGFRPFVWQLAHRLGVRGQVSNDAEGVLILAAGQNLDAFERALKHEAPALAVVETVEVEVVEGAFGGTFEIVASGPQGAETRVTPDAATCPDCLAEIRTPGERRYGYPFANCTNCGPRYSILNALPYDRAQTTMAPFEMCAACRAEYEDPADRRFHAQPIACPRCGPSVWLEDRTGAIVDGDSLELAAGQLRQGRIFAIKGLGGFHLACDATQAEVVAELRQRKRRPIKPFALMAPLETIERHGDVTNATRDRLRSAAAPIVLIERSLTSDLPEEIAPGQGRLGWMLPATPLHHILLDLVDAPLVMTSGNLSGEPQVIGNNEAREKLSHFVDGSLMHDRDIARRLDDGVEIIGPTGPVVLRRARGSVPGTIPIPETLPDRQVLALGGQLKSAICLTKNRQALLSNHLGDLDDALCVDEFLKADRDMAALFDHRPESVAVDLHPDFRATRHGHALADAQGLPVFEVQHHHAHMAAALGEAGWTGSVAIGMVLDGLGLGPDGTVWGGEVLAGGYADYERSVALKPAPLVGGDRAQSEPWRNAVVRLDQAGLSNVAERLFRDKPIDVLRSAAAVGVNAPMSSSVGRLFDAVAACLGIATDRQTFEGEAAMRLQALAEKADTREAYPYAFDGQKIDPVPMFESLASDLESDLDHGVIAARFHGFVATAFANAALASAEAVGTDTIALSGGCFQNVLLLRRVIDELPDMQICGPGQVPANDGGLAFGQALVALARMESY
ncbi:carbamoyltransferase HypF [Cognatiyoonia sp. IB215182]|uniref:carbamoyltransferase HypF n=1 Tax=Cognatiyoonia sp. IB215182 TaxID=3097353 RepID=UPI002A157BA7|nr:carbamoyltransferase HypF [Cognatiyoonia sp. IB215182]MDX8355484.1 carbamoyltransferase HypF [Cognatiyoonia sp. IB215182]